MTPKAGRRIQAIVFNVLLAAFLLTYQAEQMKFLYFLGFVFTLYALIIGRVVRAGPDAPVATPLLQLVLLTTTLQLISLRGQVAAGIDNFIDYTIARGMAENGWSTGFGATIPNYEVPFPFLHATALMVSAVSGLQLSHVVLVQPLVTSKASILLVFVVAATLFRHRGAALVPTLLFAMSWQFLDFHSWFAKEGLALAIMLAVVHLYITSGLRKDFRYALLSTPAVLALVLTQTLAAVFAFVIMGDLYVTMRVGSAVTKSPAPSLPSATVLLLFAWLVFYWSILANTPIDWFYQSVQQLTSEVKLRFLQGGESSFGARFISLGSMVFAVLFFALAALQTRRLLRERRFLALGFVVVGGLAGLLAAIFTLFALYRGSGTVSGGRFLLFSALGSAMPLAAPFLERARAATTVFVTVALLLFVVFNGIIMPTARYVPQDHDDPGLYAAGLTGRWSAMSWMNGTGVVGIQGAYQAALPLWQWRGMNLTGYDVSDFYKAGGFYYVILNHDLRSQYESAVSKGATDVLYDNGVYLVMRD